MTRNYNPTCPKLMNPTIFRLFSKLTFQENGCWVFNARLDGGGYGSFRVGAEVGDGSSRKVTAHRFLYECMKGPVDSGLDLDHLCRNRACCNPAHLEPVTHKENCRRGRGGAVSAARQQAKTHCPLGHEYTPENTYTHRNMRSCRECRAAVTIQQNERRRRLRKAQEN